MTHPPLALGYISWGVCGLCPIMHMGSQSNDATTDGSSCTTSKPSMSKGWGAAKQSVLLVWRGSNNYVNITAHASGLMLTAC